MKLISVQEALTHVAMAVFRPMEEEDAYSFGGIDCLGDAFISDDGIGPFVIVIADNCVSFIDEDCTEQRLDLRKMQIQVISL